MSGAHANPTSGNAESADSDVATRVVHGLTQAGIRVATGESLTAGQLAARLADVPGASAILWGGVVAYQVSVKRDVLGVDAALLAEKGPVDSDVVEQMAEGAARICGAQLGLATTGVAGPEAHGGHDAGTVYIGWAILAGNADSVASQGHRRLQIDGDRARIRQATVDAVMALIEELLASF